MRKPMTDEAKKPEGTGWVMWFWVILLIIAAVFMGIKFIYG